MTQIAWLLLGGVIGTLLRYLLSAYAYQFTSGLFPVGTVTVNLAGCLVIGLLWGALDVDNLSQEMRNLIFIGLLGAFTTYSTYSLDTLNLFRFGEWKLAVVNVLVSNIGGILLTALGFFIGRWFHSVIAP